jgi:hypothetical protein
MQPLRRPARTDYHCAEETDFSKAYYISLTASSMENFHPVLWKNSISPVTPSEIMDFDLPDGRLE